jgi:predicted nuclease of predicted toxin-antitoxin system
LARLKIYTDENVDVRIAEGLKRRGIKAFSAHEKDMIGASDIEHFKYASKIKAVIFTHDHHFLKIAREFVKGGKNHWGVIFVEMNRLSVGECVKRLTLYAEILPPEEMKNLIEFL